MVAFSPKLPVAFPFPLQCFALPQPISLLGMIAKYPPSFCHLNSWCDWRYEVIMGVALDRTREAGCERERGCFMGVGVSAVVYKGG